MRFRDYYHFLGKKGKLAFYLIVFVGFFSFLFTIATISFIGIRLIGFSRESLPIEKKIPEISLKNEKGTMVNLMNVPPTKKLLLFFKPKCAACRMELSNLQYISKKYSREKIKIFVISEAGEEETKRLLETYRINFPMLMDADKSLKKIFKFHSTPALFLIDENNIIKYGRVGYKTLSFDEMVIREFLQSSKIPAEIFGSEEDEKQNKP